MIDRTFIRWNALLFLVALLFWLAKLFLGPGEQPKDPARPEALAYQAQRHEALRSESGSPMRDREPNHPDSPPDPAARRGSAD